MFSLPIGRRIFVAIFLGSTSLLEAQPAKVLFLGNSFTRGAGGTASVPTIFDALANAAGQPAPLVTTRTADGQTFSYHATHNLSDSIINSEVWTHAVIQNSSTQPTHTEDASKHFSGGTALYNKILAKSPTAKVVLYETWSRSAVDELITGTSTPTTFATTAEMQYELRTNYLALANDLNTANPGNSPVAVAPVGDAWEAAGALLQPTDPAFIDLFNNDDYHGNDCGYYLAATVIYSTIYGGSPVGLHLSPGVKALGLLMTDKEAGRLEEIAWRLVRLYAAPPPSGVWLTSASCPDGQRIELRLSKPLPAGSLDTFEPVNYVVANRGRLVPITSAALSADGMVATLALASEVRGRFVAGLPDGIPIGVGNPGAPELWLSSGPPEAPVRRILLDLGAADLVTGPADDHARSWNSITPEIGAIETGVAPGLLTTDGAPSPIGFQVARPFTAAQKPAQVTATNHPDYPESATNDTLTGAAGISPAFKLTGLDPARSYTLEFFASGGVVSTNQETLYTVTGTSVQSASLNAAGNISRSAVVSRSLPSASGELLVELSAAANNSAGITYLGIVEISEDPLLVPEVYAPQVVRGQFYLDWKGDGALESSSDLAGPWLPVESSPQEGYVSPLTSQPRFFRLRYAPAQ